MSAAGLTFARWARGEADAPRWAFRRDAAPDTLTPWLQVGSPSSSSSSTTTGVPRIILSETEQAPRDTTRLSALSALSSSASIWRAGTQVALSTRFEMR